MSDTKLNHPTTPEMPIDENVSRVMDWDISSQPKASGEEGDITLEVDNLKMYFPVTKGLLKRKIAEVKAVDNVSFKIKRGETLGIVGESGSGKTTVGNCIMHNCTPTEGKVILEGQDITNLKKKELVDIHQKLTMITQDPFASLDPRFRVEDSILEGVRIHKMVKGKDEERDLARRMMMMVGLNPDYGDRYPHEFSGGQRQRISIARALAMNPSVIICDEIVSALDVSIQAQIVGLMMRLQKELKLTYVFIGHDLSVVRHISNNVAVMYLGKFMEMTSSDELYDNPLHPYTQALISAAPIPKPRVDRQRERILLKGEIPSPMNPPKGCVFSTRCPYATQQCKEVEPPLVDTGNGHMVACHRVSGK